MYSSAFMRVQFYEFVCSGSVIALFSFTKHYRNIYHNMIIYDMLMTRVYFWNRTIIKKCMFLYSNIIVIKMLTFIFVNIIFVNFNNELHFYVYGLYYTHIDWFGRITFYILTARFQVCNLIFYNIIVYIFMCEFF